jgi:hypothetical protein
MNKKQLLRKEINSFKRLARRARELADEGIVERPPITSGGKTYNGYTQTPTPFLRTEVQALGMVHCLEHYGLVCLETSERGKKLYLHSIGKVEADRVSRTD